MSKWQKFLKEVRDPKNSRVCVYCQSGQRCPWGCKRPKARPANQAKIEPTWHIKHTVGGAHE